MINGKVRIFTDGEGGNIEIISPTDSRWQFDCYEGTSLRIFSQHSDNSFGPSYTLSNESDGGVIATESYFSTNSKYRWFADDTSGSAFNKDFLSVSLTDKLSTTNQASFFNIGFVDEASEWKNRPTSMPTRCAGLREVYWADSNSVAVKITESYPSTGKQYYNYYHNGWQGWKSISPS